MVQGSKRDTTSVFGRRLRAARIDAALSQFRLGVNIGIDEASSSARISRYEAGIHEPAIEIARSLALALKIPLAFLYCDDDLLSQILLNAHKMTKDEKRALLKSWQVSGGASNGKLAE